MSDSETQLPQGYRQGLVTAITVILGFSLAFLRFWGLEAKGQWEKWSVITAALLVLGIAVQLYSLYRSLQLRDNDPRVFRVTVGFFFTGVTMAVVAIVGSIVLVAALSLASAA